ncbi:MAG TPA: nucleotide exchange factor GrpE [Propionicimonas sp.]|uniref:nucleotide exchange factor GrpE n=1 Tax=Propionicimonas sp. TaxID=1955623 RepID=UPI002F42C185
MTDSATTPEPEEGPEEPAEEASSSSAGMFGGPDDGLSGFVPDGEAGGDGAEEPIEAKAATGSPVRDAKLAEMQELVDERTNDLQRLHAEYSNYKKRVDRDRLLARQGGVEVVILDLLPVLDSVEAAREHAELVGGFKLVADELEKITAKYGLETFGEVGEEFDPQIHEALMQMPIETAITVPTISAVMQRGVKLNDRVLRPARVGVANPE